MIPPHHTHNRNLTQTGLLFTLSLSLLLSVWSGQSRAEEPEISVTHSDGVFRVMLKVETPHSVESIYARLTDYTNLTNVNPAIRKSRVLPQTSGEKKQIMTLARGCILGFCKSVQKVETVSDQNHMMISMEIVPGRSDFSFGKSRWLIMPSGTGSKIEYYSAMTPSFSIPPFIGPWFLNRWLTQELRNTASNLIALKPAE